jgi:hypothetical protein
MKRFCRIRLLGSAALLSFAIVLRVSCAAQAYPDTNSAPKDGGSKAALG